MSARISQCASDRNELGVDIEAIRAALGRPETVLADNRYANGTQVTALERILVGAAGDEAGPMFWNGGSSTRLRPGQAPSSIAGRGRENPLDGSQSRKLKLTTEIPS